MQQPQSNRSSTDRTMVGARWRGPGAVAVGMLVLIVVFYFAREHWGHIAGFWPYLLLLMCPLMHLFGHGGHDHARRP